MPNTQNPSPIRDVSDAVNRARQLFECSPSFVDPGQYRRVIENTIRDESAGRFDGPELDSIIRIAANPMGGVPGGYVSVTSPNLDSFAYRRMSSESNDISPTMLEDMEVETLQHMGMTITKPKGLTGPEKIKLSRATDKVLREIEDRARAANEDQPRLGNRESQYLELLKEEKAGSLTTEEFIDTETPIHVSAITGDRISAIARSGECGGIYRGEPGQVIFSCVKCQRKGIPAQYLFIQNSSCYCAEHLPTYEACTTCGNFTEDCRPVTTFDNRNILMCTRCVRNRATCRSCEAPISIEYAELRLCERHVNHTGEGRPWRKFSWSLNWGSDNDGKVIKTQRMFSCEIEAISPESSDVIRLGDNLPKECGMSTDGSLRTDSEAPGEPFEVQTPRLRGERGEELIYRMGSALQEASAKVNNSCGMHIHLDGKGISTQSRKESPTALLQLWKAHLVFEDVMLSFLPFSRRRNDFCRPMSSAFKTTELDICDSLLDAEKLWYKERTYNAIKSAKGHHYHSSRYFGVNFHSLLANGHLEIRYHSGTTNPRKVLEWANLHALVMDAAAAKKFDHEFLADAQASSLLKEKTKLLFDKIGLAEPSRRYFLARQKKFSARAANESAITTNE